MTNPTPLDQRAINTIRFLAIDAVQKAKSGHPGTPMGAAALAYTLWDRFLQHNPQNPRWPNRDRFILSPGHASMLLYALLYLTGYDLPLKELQNFRQWGSKTPGHPEYGHTPGVEVTTGPLGQGFAHAVGMAIAEQWMADHFNRPGYNLFDHYTYVLASDGDMQEGVSSEAASLAGTLGLNKLICLYDDNEIQIEGETDMVFRENVARRFEAYMWRVIGPVDGLNVTAVEEAIDQAQAEAERPTLIICQTIIGYGSPRQNTAQVHGEPLGEENIRATKEHFGWPQEPPFYTPDDVCDHMRRAIERGERAEREWQQMLDRYTEDYPEEAQQLSDQLQGHLPSGWDEELSALFTPDSGPIATRVASGQVLNNLIKYVHALAGGSADLAPSTKTILFGYGDFGMDEHCAHNMHFGVREHAMGAIAGGMALHGGLIPYTATFLTFSDYMRPPMRLAAMMGIHVIYVFTHDSIGLGKDGPTHQPIEHLMNLRTVPNLTVIRPADATETAEAWRAALLNKSGPTALIFSRQKLPVLDRAKLKSARGVQRGGYILWESADGKPDVILIASGSEIHIALEAGRKLAVEDDALHVRVVSLPSWEMFDRQPLDYRERVLPPDVRARVAVEAAQALGWEHFVGVDGTIVGLRTFGASAPGERLYEEFGLTPACIIAQAKRVLSA